MKSGFVHVNNGNLYYESIGSGDCIVLIHGMGLDTRIWDNQVEEFSRHFQVVRYDIRGHGRSSMPTNQNYSHHDDLKQLMDILEVDKSHIIGISMGGGIATNYTLEYADRVNSLILANSALDGYVSSKPDEKLYNVYDNIEKNVASQDINAARKLWNSLPHFKPLLRVRELAYQLNAMTETYSFWHFANKNPIIRPQVPAIDRLKEINKPCLLIEGELDLNDFREISEIMNHNIDNSIKHTIPNVGHISCMEDPVSFNRIVMNFVSNFKEEGNSV